MKQLDQGRPCAKQGSANASSQPTVLARKRRLPKDIHGPSEQADKHMRVSFLEVFATKRKTHHVGVP